MAEERFEISVTPEITVPKDGNLRRGPTGRTNSSTKEKNDSPNYLRASTGSCHDFCKYGREHAIKEKERRPLRKRITGTLDECQKSAESVTLQKRENKTVINPRFSIDSKLKELDIPKVVNKGTQFVKQVAAGLKKKPASPAKINGVTAKPAKINGVTAKPAVVSKLKHAVEKSPSSPSNPPKGGSKSNGIMKVENNGGSKVVQKKVLPKVSLSPRASLNRALSLNARKYRNLKSSSPLKNQNMVRKSAPKPPNEEDVREKTIYVVEPKHEEKSLGPAEDGALTSQWAPFSSPPPPLSLSSSTNDEEEHAGSESTFDEEHDESEYEEIEKKKESETANVDCKRKPRRGATAQPEGEDPAQKVNFRRGTVLNPHSEYNTPRKLRFRPGRVLGVTENGKSEARSKSKKREVGDGDSTSGKPRSEKVVLRHQDVSGKKDAQGLFNNVIEETANKLAVTRKSKVKALVGAFETVISLQESKRNLDSSG